MTTAWRTFFEELYPADISAEVLPHPAATAMATMLGSGACGGAKLVGCRGGNAAFPDGCLLLIDVEVALGQRKVVHDIRAVEPMAFVYARSDLLPAVCPLRDGFPVDVPHLNLTARDVPRSLCLFEMPPEEALRLATPLVFRAVQRYGTASILSRSLRPTSPAR